PALPPHATGSLGDYNAVGDISAAGGMPGWPSLSKRIPLGSPTMKKSAIALVLLLTVTAAVMARPGFGAITSVDAEKNTITYTITFGKDRGTEIKTVIHKDCVIK